MMEKNNTEIILSIGELELLVSNLSKQLKIGDRKQLGNQDKENEKFRKNVKSLIDLTFEYNWLKTSFTKKEMKSKFNRNDEEIIMYVSEAQKVVSKWKSQKE